MGLWAKEIGGACAVWLETKHPADLREDSALLYFCMQQ